MFENISGPMSHNDTTQMFLLLEDSTMFTLNAQIDRPKQTVQSQLRLPSRARK